MKNDIIFEDAADVIGAVNFSALDGANIFVTGATGLLGTHFLASLCLLREAGYRFSVVGHHQSTPAAFTKDIVRRGGFRLTRELPLGGSDIVIHAAGYAQPLRFTDSPAETIRLNTEVTSLLLRSLTPGGRFLFTSSSEVYSGSPKQVVTEYDIGTTTPYHPRACYIEGKRCGEAICYAYRGKGVPAVSARLGATYGPGTKKHDRRVINSFIEQALTKKRIEPEFSSSGVRSYCYVSDAIKMLWQILLHGIAPVYNVGSVTGASVDQLADCIGEITDAAVLSPKTKNALEGSANNPALSMELIDAEFGPSPYYSLGAGLERTIEWQKGLYQ